jgi:IS30 family transposase
MASKIGSLLEYYITAFSEEKFLYQQIIKWCKNHGYCISENGIYNKLNLKGKCLTEIKNRTMTVKSHLFECR